MNCPECGARNRPNAPFCIECGEPLELNNAPESGRVRLEPVTASVAISEAASNPSRAAGPFGSTPDRAAPDDLPFPASMIARLPRPFNPLYWGLEVRITVLVLVVAIVADLLIQGTARSDAQNYELALKAEQEHRWHDAATLLAPLVSKGYQDASAHYKNVEPRAEEFDQYYNWAQGAKVAGSLIRAAQYYKSANDIEPGYQGVDNALTDTIKSAGQVLYQSRNGLYLANAVGETTSALPGSDRLTEVLAVSSDGKLVCYTGFDITQPQTQTQTFGAWRRYPDYNPTVPSFGPGNQGFADPRYVNPRSNGIYIGGDNIGSNRVTPLQTLTRKVYIRNLVSGAMEAFDDVPYSADAMSVYRTSYFVNNDKDLLFAVYRNDTSAGSTQLELTYFDISANSGLRKIGEAYTMALPDETDTHLYYTPITSPTEMLGNSIVSYNLNSNASAVIARSTGNIGHLVLGGSANSSPGSRVLFYTAAEDADLRIYSKMPPDGTITTMLVDVADGSAGASASQINIAPANNSATAIAIEYGGTPQGWILQAAQGRATDLSSLGWDVVIDKIDYVQYSPDDSKVMIYGQAGAKPWAAAVDSSLELTLHPLMLGDNPDAIANWLGDSKHFYSYSNDGFSVMDATTGDKLVYVAHYNVAIEYKSLISLLSDNQTLLYIANEGAYISNVDGHQPAEFIPGATQVWALGAGK